jgi:hypothetical protein
MEHANWLVIAIIVIFAVAGRIGKIGKTVQKAQSRAQAAQSAYTEQMQAAQAAAAPSPPAPAPAQMINVTATGLPQRTVQPRMPGPPRPAPTPRAAPAATVGADPAPAGSTRAFVHEAFHDPGHARRAIILAELLAPPVALR